MARHIVCVLDRTVGHVSFCWDYVSIFIKYHICSLNKIIIQNKFYSNCTKMKFVDWVQLLKIFLKLIYRQMHLIYQ